MGITEGRCMLRKTILSFLLMTSYLAAMKPNKNLSKNDWKIYYQIMALEKLGMPDPTGEVKIGNRVCYQYRLPSLPEDTCEVADELFSEKKQTKSSRS